MTSELRARPAEPADYERFTRLVQELQTGDPIPPRDRWEATIAPTTTFFEDGGEVVAYSFHQVLADTGYVRHVVVDPAYRGKRYGRAVMDALVGLFRSAGCSRFCLNVKPDNTPAVRLYESVGMRAAYASTSLHLPWDKVTSLPLPSREIAARVVDPTEDTAIETAFDMPLGSLAASRKYAGRTVLRLVDPAAPAEPHVGIASFDPHFPGAFPFRVAEPSYARALLEAMRPYARPEHAHVGVVVENDPELTRTLVAHGASPRMEIMHYKGSLR